MHLPIINLPHSGAPGIYGPYQDVCIFTSLSINAFMQPLLGFAHILHYQWGSTGWCQRTMGPALWYYSAYLVYLRVSAFYRVPKEIHWLTFDSLQNYTLLPTDYIIAPASGNPNLCLSWPMALPPNSDGIDWQMGSFFRCTKYNILSIWYQSRFCIPPYCIFYFQVNYTYSKAD